MERFNEMTVETERTRTEFEDKVDVKFTDTTSELRREILEAEKRANERLRKLNASLGRLPDIQNKLDEVANRMDPIADRVEEIDQRTNPLTGRIRSWRQSSRMRSSLVIRRLVHRNNRFRPSTSGSSNWNATVLVRKSTTSAKKSTNSINTSPQKLRCKM